MNERVLGVTQLGVSASESIKRLLAALERIECHVPFETRPWWQQRELEIRKGPRWSAYAEAASQLSLFGANLPNCFQEIRNAGNGVWNRVLDMARLGLGEDLRDFRITTPRRGQLARRRGTRRPRVVAPPEPEMSKTSCARSGRRSCVFPSTPSVWMCPSPSLAAPRSRQSRCWPVSRNASVVCSAIPC